MGKPVVGITTYLTRAAWGAWDLDAALVPAAYVRAVARAGGCRCSCRPGAAVDETLDVGRRLIFSGGSDLDPELYGAEAHDETDGVVRERDDFELALMQAALARDLPVLAICRGSQVLNVALGGGIEQHVPDRVGTDVHKETPGVFAEHDVAVLPETTARVDPRRPRTTSSRTTIRASASSARACASRRARPRRHGRGARGPDETLHPRRPVAPRRGRRPGALRSAGRSRRAREPLAARAGAGR